MSNLQISKDAACSQTKPFRSVASGGVQIGKPVVKIPKSVATLVALTRSHLDLGGVTQPLQAFRRGRLGVAVVEQVHQLA